MYTTGVYVLVCWLFVIIIHSSYKTIKGSCFILMNELSGANFPRKSASCALNDSVDWA